jgi:hypothetical protein
MLREVRLPGLRSAEQIKTAATLLVDADWLRAPVIGFGAQSKVVYGVNNRLWGRNGTVARTVRDSKKWRPSRADTRDT